MCVLITSSFYRFWFRFLFVCVLRSSLRQLQVLNGGEGRQQLQPLWDPLSPSCEGAVARATPRTGPRPHSKSSLSLKKRVENVEVKGHCCSCRPGSLPGRSRFAESRDLESCVFCYIFVETQRKAGREELPTGFEAQREGCLVGQAKSHPLPLKLGLPSVTQPIIFLT